jgi:hypothetical protein
MTTLAWIPGITDRPIRIVQTRFSTAPYGDAAAAATGAPIRSVVLGVALPDDAPLPYDDDGVATGTVACGAIGSTGCTTVLVR